MHTIKELKEQEKYKNMLKRKNKEKNIYKAQNETLRIKYEGIKKLLEKKDDEIERLNNIINEFEIWLLEHSKVDYDCAETIVHEQLALGIAFNYLQELKGSDKNEDIK